MTNVQANLRFGEVIAEHWTLQQLEVTDVLYDAYAARSAEGERVRVFVLKRAHRLPRELRKAFVRSAWLANTIEHPAVPRVLSATQCEDGSPAVITTGSRGEPLDAFLARRRGRVAPTDASRLVAEALSTLGAAHERSVVHGHLRPSTCWLNEDGGLELLGFGWGRITLECARQLGDLEALEPYRHPERGLVVASEVGDDLWGVGALFFELLTGLAIEEVRARGAGRLTAFFPNAPEALARFADLLLTWSADGAPNRALLLARTAHSLSKSAELGRLLSLRSPVPPPPSFAPPPMTNASHAGSRPPSHSSPFLRHSEVARLAATDATQRVPSARRSDSGKYARTFPSEPTRPFSRSTRRGA